MRVERSFRGISRRLAVHYLENLGGERVADDEGAGDETATVAVAGDGWRATLSEDSASVGPSLTLTEVTVVFEGDAEAVEPMVADFARKAMRAGG